MEDDAVLDCTIGSSALSVQDETVSSSRLPDGWTLDAPRVREDGEIGGGTDR